MGYRYRHRAPLRAALLGTTALVAASVALIGAAAAQPSTWTGAIDNVYGTAGNWSGGAPPPDSNTKSANFATGGANTNVNVAAPVTVQSWNFSGTTSYTIVRIGRHLRRCDAGARQYVERGAVGCQQPRRTRRDRAAERQRHADLVGRQLLCGRDDDQRRDARGCEPDRRHHRCARQRQCDPGRRQAARST